MLRRLRIENLVLIRKADLDFADGLNALTGETGAGKTIIAQAIGLLLGTRGDAASIGPGGPEAYVEAELEVPEGFFDDDDLAGLAELRPEGEAGIVIARRIFADGRTRAYAWGRGVARDDLAAAAEKLVAMSGQFEQRRLSHHGYQLDTLDAFVGPEQLALREEARRAWRELARARRRHLELVLSAETSASEVAELRALVEASADLRPGEEEALRAERERFLRVAELGQAAASAARAVAPDEGEGAATLAALAEKAVAPLAALAPELARAASELRDLSLRLREVGSDLHAFLAALEADPAALERVEERLETYAGARRRFGAASTEELLARRTTALQQLEGLDGGVDPVESAAAALRAAEQRCGELADRLSAARREAAPAFATAVGAELREVGVGDGDFRVEIEAREPGAAGADDVRFLIRPNQGLPFGPVADTASGGERSRIALALAAVAGGRTLVFDEIDAGIGGVTAHRVAQTLARLARTAQVLTITHLPQIASAADRQFRVLKVPGDPTHTTIELLDEAARREELERMLGGEEFLAAVAGEER